MLYEVIIQYWGWEGQGWIWIYGLVFQGRRAKVAMVGREANGKMGCWSENLV